MAWTGWYMILYGEPLDNVVHVQVGCFHWHILKLS